MAWTEEQLRNAQIIYQVGMELGASVRDVQIAIMAAIVESGLRNLDYGDRDSIGMFQQRDAWGTREARLDPYQSARMFFVGGHAGQRGLLDFANRDNMGMGEAAQAVQVSAFPDRYAEHQSDAAGLISQVGNGESMPDTTTSTETTLGQILDPNDLIKDLQKQAQANQYDQPGVTEVDGLGAITAEGTGAGEMTFGNNYTGAAIGNPLDPVKFGQPTSDPMDGLKMPTLEQLGISSTSTSTTEFTGTTGGDTGGLAAFAKKFLGTPYVWGGTSPTGFDCSGFVQYVMKQFGHDLPRISADQARAGQRVSLKDLQAGDLIAWDNSSRNVGADHIAIYLGNGILIEAPRPGGVVQLSHLYDTGEAWGVRL